MNRWKAVPWVLMGVALVAVSLVAAGMNSPPSANGGDKVAPSPSPSVVGPTVVGTVDTADGVLPIMPPGVPAMGSLTVKKVYAKGGVTVAPGDVLVEFDASTVIEAKTQADHAVTEAEGLANQARKKVELHQNTVEEAKLGVKKAENDLTAAEKEQKMVSDTLEENLKFATQTPPDRTPLTEAQKELRRSRSPELLKANTDLESAKVGVEAAKLKLKTAEASVSLLNADVERASAAVAIRRAAAAQAAAVVESFKLKAQVAGVVEQIEVRDGMSVGPTTRTPLMYLVPAGPRIVRAEVEAEFAHKIDGFVGKPVTVYAGEKFNDAYPGTARRVSGAFLPKRFGGDSFVTTPARVLECVIDLTDPVPSGKSLLRPGQPVRVTFGN